MSEENKIVELNDEELEKVNGGGVTNDNGVEFNLYNFVSTPFEYVAGSLPAHYYEWCTQIMGLSESEGTAFIRLYIKTSYSGNFKFVDFGGVPLNALSVIECPTWLGM